MLHEILGTAALRRGFAKRAQALAEAEEEAAASAASAASVPLGARLRAVSPPPLPTAA